RVHRGLDAVHPRYAGRAHDGLCPERPAGRTGRDRRATDAQLEPGKHLRRRRRLGGHAMTDRITRKTFLRRAAASGSILTVPGLLAACGGGGGGGGGTTSKQLAKTLHFSNWTPYMDRKLKHH